MRPFTKGDRGAGPLGLAQEVRPKFRFDRDEQTGLYRGKGPPDDPREVDGRRRLISSASFFSTAQDNAQASPSSRGL